MEKRTVPSLPFYFFLKFDSLSNCKAGRILEIQVNFNFLNRNSYYKKFNAYSRLNFQ